MAQRVKRLPAMWETWVRSLGWEDPLEKEMATHSSILAWRIPWTEELGGLQSMGSRRVGHNRVTSQAYISGPRVSLCVCVYIYIYIFKGINYIAYNHPSGVDECFCGFLYSKEVTANMSPSSFNSSSLQSPLVPSSPKFLLADMWYFHTSKWK